MEVSAEEYMNWGRTRLRVELKKRGLSPSGLKTELLARLEEYFKRQRAASGGAAPSRQQQPSYGPNNNNASHSNNTRPAVNQPHLLPKQHHSKQLLELFQHNQHQLQQQHQLLQQHKEAAALSRAVPRKRPRKSQTPRRGLQPQGSAENTSSEGEGSDHSQDNDLATAEPSSTQPNKKPRLGRQYQQQHESDDCGNGSDGSPAKTTLLSGRSFKKESGQVQAPHAEVRSVETIAFGPGSQFHFTHRFWRGKLLRRRFDFLGTYSIVPASPLGEESRLSDLAELSSAAASERGDAAEESRLKELSESKVILHWPSKLDAPELRDWQFDKNYSYLFLATTPLPSSPATGPAAEGTDSAFLQPGSTSPLLATSSPNVDAGIPLKRPLLLYTKHSAAFVEDSC